MKKISRGLRNNNPGNIEKSKDLFQGEISPSEDGRFKQFQTIAYVYRAMFILLGNYLLRYHLDTISKIINRWAPSVENHTQNYIDKVSLWSGVAKDKVLTEFNGNDFIKIVGAMSKMENGIDADMKEVEAGFRMQSKIKG